MTVAHLPLSQAVGGFLLARTADGYSPHTISQYEWALGRLTYKVGDKPLKDVTTTDIREFLTWLRKGYVPNRPDGNEKPLSDTSIFAAWKAVRAFYKWAVPELGVDNVALKISKPPHSYPEVIPFSEGDVKKIIEACEYTAPAKTTRRTPFRMRRPTWVRDKSIVLVLLDTGVRVSELCDFNVISYDGDLGHLHVNPRGAGHKSRPRTLPLSPLTRKTLWMYLVERECEKRDPLFVTKFDTRMSKSEVLHMVKRAGERAGVERCYPHRFRHTFAIMYLKNGGNVFALQKLLGHTTLKMVQTYVTLSQVDVSEAHRRFGPVGNIQGLK